MNLLVVIFYCAFSLKIDSSHGFDPISMGAAFGGIVYYQIKDNLICKFTECCIAKEIPSNFTKLEDLLEQKLFGQHIVKDIVVNAIKAHWNSNFNDVNNHNSKALTLSFHGFPGTGKNYVAGFIRDSLFNKGSESIHVHYFNGRISFPLESHIQEYQENLYNWIKGNVTRCPKQLFVFDEVDKIPIGLLNVLKPIIDYNEALERVDYRQTIFIFLSNTGSKAILEETLKLWRNGIKRDDFKLKHFEKLIAMGAFNEEGGFHRSDTIKNNLIDHYVPFLPLERNHVRQCVLEEFKVKGATPEEEHIQDVMDYVEFGPESEKIYSLTGCKRLSQKVAMVIQKYRLK